MVTPPLPHLKASLGVFRAGAGMWSGLTTEDGHLEAPSSQHKTTEIENGCLLLQHVLVTHVSEAAQWPCFY